MILRRLGNKKKLAADIIKHFPPHKIYMEPFFGAGGIFFSKKLAKHNYLNDLDSDVFNLFQVLIDKDKKQELYDLMKLAPLHQDLMKHWVANKETEPIKKAARFLFLSNYSYLGKNDNLRFICRNAKNVLLYQFAQPILDLIENAKFANVCFRKFLPQYQVSGNEGKQVFVYNDPPYLKTGNNYENAWTKNDTIDLFDTMINSGHKFAISEFENPIIADMAKQANLETIPIRKRTTLKNENTEVLIVNYESPALYSLFSGEHALINGIAHK